MPGQLSPTIALSKTAKELKSGRFGLLSESDLNLQIWLAFVTARQLFVDDSSKSLRNWGHSKSVSPFGRSDRTNSHAVDSRKSIPAHGGPTWLGGGFLFHCWHIALQSSRDRGVSPLYLHLCGRPIDNIIFGLPLTGRIQPQGPPGVKTGQIKSGSGCRACTVSAKPIKSQKIFLRSLICVSR